jgi:hypothetical protein
MRGATYGAGAMIATTSGAGAALVSCAAGGDAAGATVVLEQQHCARIVDSGAASCCFAFEGQQHECRTWPSMRHKKLVRANADDGSSTANASRVRITRRTISSTLGPAPRRCKRDFERLHNHRVALALRRSSGMSHVLSAIGRGLHVSAAMGWEILWPLVLGFTLSAIVQAVVSKRELGRLLPDASPRTLAVACALGAASSSCSYAAVALTRSLVRKGADFTAAMAFELASTNLVAELSILMFVVLGWQFFAAEAIGAVLMVASIAVLFRVFSTRRLVERARAQADRGVAGRMEGHAEMDMAVTEGPLWRRVLSKRGATATSHYFVMDWVSIAFDLALGLVIAGALAAWVPASFWSSFFLTSHPTLAKIWGPLVGPLIAMCSFVCSVGNVPLAAVLWNSGISFGGVIAFLFADLLVLPILDIYRRYYGIKMTGFILVTFYVAMVAAAYIVELGFDVLGWIPHERGATVVEAAFRWNYTTVLDLIFLVLAVALVVRFLKTGGPRMLKMMNHPIDDASDDHRAPR